MSWLCYSTRRIVSWVEILLEVKWKYRGRRERKRAATSILFSLSFSHTLSLSSSRYNFFGSICLHIYTKNIKYGYMYMKMVIIMIPAWNRWCFMWVYERIWKHFSKNILALYKLRSNSINLTQPTNLLLQNCIIFLFLYYVWKRVSRYYSTFLYVRGIVVSYTYYKYTLYLAFICLIFFSMLLCIPI